MVVSMLLAHFVGDYVLQWNQLARWKSQMTRGVLVHGLIIILVTFVFAVVLDPSWWLWALLIGIAHTAVDLAQFHLFKEKPTGLAALLRLLADQTVHIAIIFAALFASGVLQATLPFGEQLLSAVREYRLLSLTLAYVILAMPTWIMIEFILNTQCPTKSKSRKYAGIVERALWLTCLLSGWVFLLPLAIVPRIVTEGRWGQEKRPLVSYTSELILSGLSTLAVGLAVGILL